MLVLAVISAALSCLAQDSSAPAGRSLDWPGQVTIAVALFALLFAVIQGPTSGWGSGEVIGGFIVAAVFTVLFVVAENRSAGPAAAARPVRQPCFAIASIVTVIGMFAFLGTAYATSIRLSAIQGFTPLKTSIAFRSCSTAWRWSCCRSPPGAGAYAPKWALGAGLVMMGAGDLWLAAYRPPTCPRPASGPLLLIGIGIGFALAVLSPPSRSTGCPRTWPAWPAAPTTCCATSASPSARP